MRTVIAIPSMPRMTGGIAVFYQLADRLRECGFDVALTGPEGALGLVDKAVSGFPVLPWSKVAGKEGVPPIGPGDIFLIPEGWPNMGAPALNAGARLVVYVQNWAYLFSALPAGVTWHDIPAEFIAVSDPVAHFLDDVRLPARGVIRPAIDTALFRPTPEAMPDASKVVRVAWMPRKNKGLAEQIKQIVTARLFSNTRLDWVEIRDMDRAEVAQTLASCHIFLATGFPEGFALPPLEAMASGCIVVGFSGAGGWDYMRQAAPGFYTPRFPLRNVGWEGNGLFAPDGDVLEAAFLLEQAVVMAQNKTPGGASMREQGLVTAASYSAEAQRDEVQAVWNAFAMVQ